MCLWGWSQSLPHQHNGIGGFHKNLVTFRGPKLPDSLLTQKLRLKKCSSLVQCSSKKLASLVPWRQNTKWRKISESTESTITGPKYFWIQIFLDPPAPMNHVKYLRAGPAGMPFQNWYTANTNHFHLTDSWKSKTQLGWVINPVPHNLVRRIRFWRIKISWTWFYIFVLDNK